MVAKKIIKIKDGRQSYLKPRVVHPEYGWKINPKREKTHNSLIKKEIRCPIDKQVDHHKHTLTKRSLYVTDLQI